MAYIIPFIFWEQLEPLFEESNELGGHLIQLVEVTIRINVTESGSDWLIDEEHIGEFIPRSFVVLQRIIVLESIRSHLHQCAVHGAASRSTVQPDDSPLAVGDMTILKMPEKEIAVVFRVHLYMTDLSVSSFPPCVP